MKDRTILKTILEPFVIVAAALYFVIDALALSSLKPLLRKIANLNFSYRYLHSLCRLVETFAHTSRQLPRGNCHAISRRLWPIRSDHGSAPFDPTYSMISSALASNDYGMLRPSALAVLRLTISSNLSGACTGKS